MMASEDLCVSENLIWVGQVGRAPGSPLVTDNRRLICCSVKKKSNNNLSGISNLLLDDSNDLPGLCKQSIASFVDMSCFFNIFL